MQNGQQSLGTACCLAVSILKIRLSEGCHTNDTWLTAECAGTSGILWHRNIARTQSPDEWIKLIAIEPPLARRYPIDRLPNL